VHEAAARMKARLFAIEGTLTRLPGPSPMRSPPRALNLGLSSLTSVVQSADTAPTKQSFDVCDVLSAKLAAQVAELKGVLSRDVPDFMEMAGRQ